MPLKTIASGALGSLILATSAGAADLSAFGIELGMTVDEARAAAEARGLKFDARTSELNAFPFPFLVNDVEVDVTEADFIGKEVYTGAGEGTPSLPGYRETEVQVMFFEPEAKQSIVYGLRASRAFLDDQVPRADIEGWIAERTGGKEPNCTSSIDNATQGSQTQRYFFDAEGDIVGGAEMCNEYAVRIEPAFKAERDLAAIELGAVYAAEFDIVVEQDEPDMVRVIGIRMSDLVRMREGIEARRQEMVEEADPLGDM